MNESAAFHGEKKHVYMFTVVTFFWKTKIRLEHYELKKVWTRIPVEN